LSVVMGAKGAVSTLRIKQRVMPLVHA
jgi:hypothetical protein